MSAAPRPSRQAPTPAPSWRPAILSCGIAVLTVLTFRAVLDNGFVNWGDTVDIVSNPRFRGFAAENLAWMFTTIQMGHYQPLSWLTLAGDFAVWGLDPRGFHLTSLLLHAACAVAVFFLIRTLVALAWAGSPVSGASPGIAENAWTTGARTTGAWTAWGWPPDVCAALGALLFALHPLRVESIAWATERRGPLSGLFFVLAILAYVTYARNRAAARRLYVVSLACFLLSLLAKEFSITLPAILVILDLYPLRRLGAIRTWFSPDARAVWTEKIPFAVLSAIFVVISILSSAQSKVALSLAEYGIPERLAQAFYGLTLYLVKTIMPTGLSPLYAIPPHMNPYEPRFLASAALVVAITAALGLPSWARKRYPALLAAWACYVVLLSPVLGIAQTGRQIAADRYTYLPAIGLSALVAGALVRLWVGRRSLSTLRTGPPADLAAPPARSDSKSLATGPTAGRPLALTATVALGVALALLARVSDAQTRVWRSSRTLWTHAVAVEPESPAALNNLAMVLIESHELDEAEKLLKAALAANPDFPDAHDNLGVLFATQGRLTEAIGAWERALALDPSDQTARSNLDRARKMRSR